jgi:hypothetical protein
MKPWQANIINAIILITVGLISYFVTQSPTAFIAPGFGVIFLAMTPPFKKENKVVAHIVVVLTLLLIVALGKPMSGAVADGDTAGIIRVGIMIASNLFAMIFYVKSFIDARRNR